MFKGTFGYQQFTAENYNGVKQTLNEQVLGLNGTKRLRIAEQAHGASRLRVTRRLRVSEKARGSNKKKAAARSKSSARITLTRSRPEYEGVEFEKPSGLRLRRPQSAVIKTRRAAASSATKAGKKSKTASAKSLKKAPSTSRNLSCYLTKNKLKQGGRRRPMSASSGRHHRKSGRQKHEKNGTRGNRQMHGEEPKALSSPLQLSKSAERFASCVALIRGLWEELHIPRRDRDFFSGSYFRFSRANRLRVEAQLNLLRQYREATLSVLRCIQEREHAMNTLHDCLVDLFSWSAPASGQEQEATATLKRDDEQSKAVSQKEIADAFCRARDTTLAVVEGIMEWRTHLWRPLPFRWCNENYLVRVNRGVGNDIFPPDPNYMVPSVMRSLREVGLSWSTVVLSIPSNVLEHLALNKADSDQNHMLSARFEKAQDIVSREEILQRQVMVEQHELLHNGYYIPMLRWSPDEKLAPKPSQQDIPQAQSLESLAEQQPARMASDQSTNDQATERENVAVTGPQNDTKPRNMGGIVAVRVQVDILEVRGCAINFDKGNMADACAGQVELFVKPAQAVIGQGKAKPVKAYKTRERRLLNSAVVWDERVVLVLTVPPMPMLVAEFTTTVNGTSTHGRSEILLPSPALASRAPLQMSFPVAATGGSFGIQGELLLSVQYVP